MQGFLLWTVTAVDVATGSVEMDVVWGKTQERVGAAIRRVHRQLPVPLLGLDSDNGSEFITHGLYTYCEDNEITFTRSMPYKKNDSAHVEQKNGAVVRRLTGHGRYSSSSAFKQLVSEASRELLSAKIRRLDRAKSRRGQGSALPRRGHDPVPAHAPERGANGSSEGGPGEALPVTQSTSFEPADRSRNRGASASSMAPG
jgi:hypothetical protein